MGLSLKWFKIRNTSKSITKGTIDKWTGRVGNATPLRVVHICIVNNDEATLKKQKDMLQFTVPTRDEVSQGNQEIFDQLNKGLGFVPNLYATFAYSDTALKDYLTLQNRKSSLKAKEREVVNLVVSQVNECKYCLAAHTALGKMNGFTDEQVLEIREAKVGFDEKLSALASFVKETAENKGNASQSSVEGLFNAGYTKENFVDILVVIGDKIVSNYLHTITQIPVDFPAAPALDTVAA